MKKLRLGEGKELGVGHIALKQGTQDMSQVNSKPMLFTATVYCLSQGNKISELPVFSSYIKISQERTSSPNSIRPRLFSYLLGSSKTAFLS